MIWNDLPKVVGIWGFSEPESREKKKNTQDLDGHQATGTYDANYKGRWAQRAADTAIQIFLLISGIPTHLMIDGYMMLYVLMAWDYWLILMIFR